jgi:hypothetical protein
MLFLLIQILISRKIKENNIKPLTDSNEPTCTAGSLPTANLVGCKAAYDAVLGKIAASSRKENKENSSKNKTHIANIKEKVSSNKILFKTTVLEDVNLFIAKCVKTVCEGAAAGCNSLLNAPIDSDALISTLETNFEAYCAPGDDPVPDGDKKDSGMLAVKVNAFLVLICLTIGKIYLQN